MSLEIIGIIGLVVMLGLMFMGMPIAAAMGLVGFAGFWYIVGLTPSFAVVSTAAYAMSSKYLLTFIPLFVLMGLLAGNAGLSTDGYHAINKWIGHRRGGLAMATAIACAGFGAVCGISDPKIPSIVAIRKVGVVHPEHGCLDLPTIRFGLIICAREATVVKWPPNFTIVFYEESVAPSIKVFDFDTNVGSWNSSVQEGIIDAELHEAVCYEVSILGRQDCAVACSIGLKLLLTDKYCFDVKIAAVT